MNEPDGPKPLENRDPITDDPLMDEEHLDEALEDSFPASDPFSSGPHPGQAIPH
jgi:hypothetical protein